MFADDWKFFSKVKSLDDIFRIQNDLDLLCKWCEKNKLSLNISKCKYIHFNRAVVVEPNTYFLNSASLERVEVIRDLGVLFDYRCLFDQHIYQCKQKALMMLGFIKNTFDFTDLNVLRILYFSLVRSHLEYCCIIWSPFFQIYIAKIESVQRKFLRYIAFKLSIPTTDIIYSEIETLLNI